MSEQQPTRLEQMFGDFAPEFVRLTDDVIFGEVWTDEQLSPRDRSLATVSSLVTSGAVEQLEYHLGLALDNGLTEQELIALITHVAFYAGWPKAMSAMAVAARVLRG